jgi:hypothetical protein
MEAALALFVSQWRSFLLRYQIRDAAPSLGDLVVEYDRLVAFVDSTHPGFSVYLSVRGAGLFLPVDVPPGHRVRPAWGGAPARVVPANPAWDRPPNDMVVDLADEEEDEVLGMQASGESTTETRRRRVEDIIDLTLG